MGSANEPFAPETKAERQVVVNEAFTEEPAMMAPPATIKKIQNMFDRIGALTKDGTTPAVSKYFDYREMTLAVFRVIGSIPRTQRQLNEAVASMRLESIRADLNPNSYFVRWNVTELRRVELSADKEVALV
ncbi:MAG: hypothetical protein L3J82_07110, partial [Planctomycetes bacterium]|nr:hypothetical protein [Planctomycetota bacterium]